MMPRNPAAYLPSGGACYRPPLERFLPPLPVGVVSAWLASHTQPGDLVVDPLGAHPLLAIEAARAGRRVLWSRNNPILWLILEVLASAPRAPDLQRALDQLLLTRHGGQRLDELLEGLYRTPCADCGQLIQPDGFVWEAGASAPHLRAYHCPHCADRGERPVSSHDLDNLRRLPAPGLHQARALHRVLHGGDYEKESIHNALACYPPRATYVVMTLINRLDGLPLDKGARRLLQAVLLCIFDDASCLWHWPPKSHRFLQLSVPGRYLEKNLWLSLSACAKLWQMLEQPVEITYWPNLPEGEGGICLYQRSLSEQAGLFSRQQPAAIATVFPRPNQAFWTLSALWSGWLWGRKAVAPMRSALARRHYNWHWFAQAVSSSVGRVTAQPQPPALAFGLLPQLSPNLYLGLLAGMAAAGMQLKGCAIRLGAEMAQCGWQRAEQSAAPPDLDFIRIIQSLLQQRGEPCDFQTILTNCITQIALQRGLTAPIGALEDGLFRQIQEKVSAVLEIERFVTRLQTGQTGASRWWLVDDKGSQPSLAERVESFIHRLLQERRSLLYLDIEKAVCSEFPGCLTPEEELVRLILESYADPSGADSRLFALPDSETEAARRQDLLGMSALLANQGREFGCQVKEGDNLVEWQDADGQPVLRYHLTVSAHIAPLVLAPASMEAVKKVIVFPGSRSRLLEYRLLQDARLAMALEGNWQFLKFRYLRWMAARENLTLDLWINLLGGDPPCWEPPKQLQFF